MFIPAVIQLFILLTSHFTPTQGFDSLLQLPRSGIVKIRSRLKPVILVGDFGAIGDGLVDDTQAFKNAWEVACSFPAQTRIVFPAGKTYLIYPIGFAGPCQSKVILTISGTIVAPKDPHVWDGLNPRKWLYFQKVNHLTVEGPGKINGNGLNWWAQSCKTNKTNPCQHAPTAITFHRCKNLRVKNFIMINSQQMHMAFTNCRRVEASYIKLVAPASSPNTDGFHISTSTGVVIRDSSVRTGDDCISIVGNSSRIQIKNIACGPGHGISIGSLGKSNSMSLVHDVMVDGAFISNTENGVRIKTWQGGSGFASNIIFQNIFMVNVSNPIIIDQYYCDSFLACQNQTSAVKVGNISYVGIKGTSATDEAIKFACSDSLPCEGLYLENILLKSYYGGITRSFCWEARGISQGPLYPSSCLWYDDTFIKQKIPSKSAIQSF